MVVKKAKIISSTDYKILTSKKKGKYNNRKTEYKGIKFDSIGEMNRYIFLKDLESLKVISDLKLQVSYDLKVNGCLICRYRADFCYVRDGLQITEDFKGVITPIFKLKAKLMKAIYGIDILITKK